MALPIRVIRVCQVCLFPLIFAGKNVIDYISSFSLYDFEKKNDSYNQEL